MVDATTGPSESSGNPASNVVVVGVIPPPVTGMTLLTDRVVQALAAAGPIQFCNWSAGTSRHGLAPLARRVARMLAAALQLVRFGWWSANPRLYLTANSGGALALTALLAFTARACGYRVYLHHHTYGYIDRYNRLMASISRILASNGTHVVHCPQMVDDFRKQYPVANRFEMIFPSVVSIDIGAPRSIINTPMHLGILSNLTIAKGVDLAIATFERLVQRNVDVRLTLAGPIGDRAAEAVINDAVKRYPGKVEHVGPVYGSQKAEYLSTIDLLLFPTQYRNESWGIVINEALAVGTPVITFDRGCTRTVVGTEAGLVVPRDADYVEVAAKQIEHWIAHPESYRAASTAAISQATYLHREGNLQLEHFAERLFATSNHTN